MSAGISEHDWTVFTSYEPILDRKQYRNGEAAVRQAPLSLSFPSTSMTHLFCFFIASICV